jgi:quercetin dioxygenase-like cupin family protein
MSMMSRRLAIPVASSLLAAAIVVIRVHGAQATLPSGIFSYDELKVQKNSTTEIRQMFTGGTHSGYRIDLHETALAAGQLPHAPHRHVHEELLLIREGTLEVTVGTRTSRVGPGSAVYIASNEEHGWKNVGASPAKYFVMALGDDK